MGLLDNLLALLVSLLEALLTRSSEGPSSDGLPGHGSHDGTGKSLQREDDDSKLADAFHLFGSNIDEARKSPAQVREKIRKSFKKLSLAHHPDRNNGSQDAVEKMQQINYDYELCTDHLDKLEGVTEDSEPEESETEEAKHEEEPEPEEAEEAEYEEHSRGRGRGRRRRRKNKKRPSYWEPDMTEEERTFRRQKSEVRNESERLARQAQAKREDANPPRRSKKKHQHRKKSEPEPQSMVSVAEQLQVNHMEWIRACEHLQQEERSGSESSSSEPPPFGQSPTSVSSMDDIDGEDSADGIAEETEKTAETEDAEKSARVRKPKHQTLETCPHELAVAVKLGHTAVVFDLLMDRAMHEVLIKSMKEMRQSRTPLGFKIDPEELEEAFMDVSIRGLDADGNTLLHFVCYYEESALLSLILMHVGEDYEKLVLKENDRGQIPADFCKIANDPAFKERIDVTTDAAVRAREERKIGNRLSKIASKVDFGRVLYSICGCMVSQWLFRRGILSSLIIVFASFKVYASPFPDAIKPEDGDQQMLLVGNIVWWVIRTWTMLLVNNKWLFCIGATFCVFCAGLELFLKGIFMFHLVLGSAPSLVLGFTLNRTGIHQKVIRFAGTNTALRDLLFLAIYAMIGWAVRDIAMPFLAALVARFAGLFAGLFTGFSTDEVSDVVADEDVKMSEMSPMEKAMHLLEQTLQEEGEDEF